MKHQFYFLRYSNVKQFSYLCLTPVTPLIFISMNKKLFLSVFIFAPVFIFAQPGFRRTDTVQVVQNSVTLKNPWVGGHNSCQFSAIDLNFDNIKDLFVFDRVGNKITTYLN